MAKTRDRLVRHSLSELQAMQAAGQTYTDWASAAEKPVPDGSDPDDAMEPVSWATTDLPLHDVDQI